MKDINIMVGRFQPITKGHYKCIEEAFSKKGVPTIICMINTKDDKVDDKHPFPSSLTLPLYKEMFKKDNKVEDIVLVTNADIVKIGEMLSGYNIVSWTCGSDRIGAYTKMSSKYHNNAHLAPDFEMIEVKRSDEDISATKVRQALLDNDKATFTKMTPLVPLSFHMKEDLFDTLREQILKVINKKRSA